MINIVLIGMKSYKEIFLSTISEGQQAIGGLYGRLGELMIPAAHKNFTTREKLSTYLDKIDKLKKEGAKLVTVFGIAGCATSLLGSRISPRSLIPWKNGRSRRTSWVLSSTP